MVSLTLPLAMILLLVTVFTLLMVSLTLPLAMILLLVLVFTLLMVSLTLPLAMILLLVMVFTPPLALLLLLMVVMVSLTLPLAMLLLLLVTVFTPPLALLLLLMVVMVSSTLPLAVLLLLMVMMFTLLALLTHHITSQLRLLVLHSLDCMRIMAFVANNVALLPSTSARSWARALSLYFLFTIVCSPIAWAGALFTSFHDCVLARLGWSSLFMDL